MTAEDLNPDAVDEPEDLDGVEDFDAWRREQKAKRGAGKRVRIFGHVVEMPTSLPLGLTIELDKVAASSDMDDIKKIVGHVYGPNALDQWVAGGADLEDFQVLLAYGVASAAGQNLTFEDAAAKIADLRAQEAKRGKAPKKANKKGKKRGPGGGSPAAGA